MGGLDTTCWALSGVLILEWRVEAAHLQHWGLPSPDTPPCVSLTALGDAVGLVTVGAARSVLEWVGLPTSRRLLCPQVGRPPAWPSGGRQCQSLGDTDMSGGTGCAGVPRSAEARSVLGVGVPAGRAALCTESGLGMVCAASLCRGCEKVLAVRARVSWARVCPGVGGRQRGPSDSLEMAASAAVGQAWGWDLYFSL